MTWARPPLSRLMMRRTMSSGRLLADACRAISESRLPLASSPATRWSFAEAADAETSATKIEARQILRIMSAPDFGDVRLVAAKWGDFVTPLGRAHAFHHVWLLSV